RPEGTTTKTAKDRACKSQNRPSTSTSGRPPTGGCGCRWGMGVEQVKFRIDGGCKNMGGQVHLNVKLLAHTQLSKWFINENIESYLRNSELRWATDGQIVA